MPILLQTIKAILPYKMNTFCRKEINAILSDLTTELQREYNPTNAITLDALKRLWTNCERNYLQKLGVQQPGEVDLSLKGSKCEYHGCTKSVPKPQPIDGKVFCYAHRSKYIKDLKNEGPCCKYVSNLVNNTGEQGVRCTSKTINQWGYCSRHHRKRFENNDEQSTPSTPSSPTTVEEGVSQHENQTILENQGILENQPIEGQPKTAIITVNTTSSNTTSNITSNITSNTTYTNTTSNTTLDNTLGMEHLSINQAKIDKWARLIALHSQ